MIYFDSSALFKLLFLERETADLQRWLADRTEIPVTSSELATVEVLRGCRRMDVRMIPAARALLADLQLIPLSGNVVEEAANIGGPLLRNLDALHLASALSISPELAAFVAYDRRLLTAAADAGLETVRPGA